MDTIRAWKDPEYRKTLDAGALSDHPSGLVSLDDNSLDDVVAGATAVVCAVSALTATVCSPTGTLCGSCNMGSVGCC